MIDIYNMLFSFDSTVYDAFGYGIISACSLPLGCLTILLWRPSARAIAFLMAFGAGALLAALTIDLVANTLAKGDFYPLAIGCISGGLIFIVLNQIVNDFGGFIRKSSTHFYHIQKIKHRRIKDILSAIKRVDVFQNLQDEEIKTLTEKVYLWEVKQDTLIFSQGEPCDELYFIVSGQIELLDPEEQSPTLFLGKNDDLGWLSFITGTPYRFVARATTNTQLWVLPKAAFSHLLATSSALRIKTQLWLKSAKVKDYLQQQHHLSEIEIDTWCQSSAQQLRQHNAYSSAILMEHNKPGFKKIAENISSFNLFNNLPEYELETISNHLVYKKYAKGNTFFHEGEASDHLFIIDTGSVSIIDSFDHFSRNAVLTSKGIFGDSAFMTGGRYTTTAIALESSSVWILRTKEFNNLIRILPNLAKHYKSYLGLQSTYQYLIQRQQLNEYNAVLWIKKATKHLAQGASINPVMDFHTSIHQQKGAPLGIWLGLMLDGIPEALVIGASLTRSGLSYSLLAGLFLSNYPEALSSSVGMKKQGMKFPVILFMWTSLMLITGVLSAIGSIYFAEVGHSAFSFTQGLAAGAMLTMIAQTMLPEAYFKGGEIIGFSTLLGFLSAIFFKTLE